ncbi:DUF2997 domain-containing protein [Bacterioplanoides sp. SCSIO 12839]|uniref:DUF2997 domain-containing protein n=1 Tax=Bacterioplanoides sp. SCSIO 12839 TaxID=2829569 RepID=UPI002103F267|nr:DUF2997 domain-containing protein [Bacterioplanoides sp. SCSIO 12839]UTW49817.1 DUF2997 domain-containing protein [Bacterioplanoides sp. SCSIO 12839]
MPEQKVVITIDEEGSVHAKTSGFKGESCLEALDELLNLEGGVSQLKKTDEYHQQQTIQKTRLQKVGR